MPRLLIATTNPAKAKSYQSLLADLGLEIVSLSDQPRFETVEENGCSFEENAILKAKGYFEQFHLPTIADDGGLVIETLGGEPGVKSHRWLGREATDEELVAFALQKMAGLPWEKRGAEIQTWAAFYDGEHLLLEQGGTRGFIVEEKPSWMEKGFPWRSILFIPEFGKLYQDLTEEEYQKIEHRRKIVARLKPRMKEALGKGARAV